MSVLDILDDMAPDQAPPTPSKRRTPAQREYDHAMQTQVKPTPVNDSVILVCGSMLTPKPIAWLWQDWIAQAKFHVFAGAPGQGKTTIMITIMATVTIGGRFPDGTRCEPANVMMWSGEDDPEDTLMPRLIAAGADISRVFFVKGSLVDGEVTPFDPARDMVKLMAAIDEIGGIKLLVVDPVVSAVTGDSHKNTEVRRSLQPLVDLAALTGAAVVGISHFSKGGQGQDPTQRVVGSVAFSAVARVVLVAAKVKAENGEDRRVLARSKSNIGPDSGGFEYHLDQVEALPGIEASRVAWGKAVEGTARELLTDPEDDEDKDTASDVVEMLRAQLTGPGWFPMAQASKPLLAAGFSKKQIWTASKKLNVDRRKGAMNEGWYWRRPGGDSEDSLEGSEHSQFPNVESSESSAESSAMGNVQ